MQDDMTRNPHANEAIAQQPEVDTVINPASLAGVLSARSTQGTYIASYLTDLAAANDGSSCTSAYKVRGGRDGLVEDPYKPHRSRQFSPGFWKDDARRLESRDLIVKATRRVDLA